MKYFTKSKADRFRKEAKALKRKKKRGVELSGAENARLRRREGQYLKSSLHELSLSMDGDQ